jgi:hypothetical protein
MNLSIPPVIRRRRWPWVLLALLVTPVVVLGAAAYSYLALDSDAAFLRRGIVRASGTEWKTTIQISLGRVSFAALRGGLSFVKDNDVIEARDALSTLRKTSVGVYQRLGESGEWASTELMSDTDKRMQHRDGPESLASSMARTPSWSMCHGMATRSIVSVWPSSTSGKWWWFQQLSDPLR